MKINENAKFPHPVLYKDSDDYLAGSFDVNYQIVQDKKLLKCNFNLKEENIQSLLNEKLAKVGVFILCLDTSKNDFFVLDSEKNTVDFDCNNYSGHVILRTIIYSTNKIKNFTSKNLHNEFRTFNWNFESGEILALTPEYSCEIGNKNLQPTETIFTFSQNKNVAENNVQLNLEEHKVVILINPKTHKQISRLREIPHGQNILLCSLYSLVLMEMFSLLSQNYEEYEEKEWFHIFSAKCDELDIKLEKNSPLESVQKILKKPLTHLFSIQEISI